MESERKITKNSRSLQIDAVQKQAYSQKVAACTVTCLNGTSKPFSLERIQEAIAWACSGYEQDIASDLIIEETINNIFDGIKDNEIADALVLAAAAFTERDPAYGHVAARLLFKKLYKQVTYKSALRSDVDHEYAQVFIAGIKKGVEQKIFTEQLLTFDLQSIAFSLVPERDHLFDYIMRDESLHLAFGVI